MARRQILIQLSDAILKQIDRRRMSKGQSRSEVVRDAVAHYLAADRELAIDRKLVEAYSRQPQRDECGGTSARRLFAEEPW